MAAKNGEKVEEVTTKDEKPVSTSAAVAELRAKSQNTSTQRHQDGTTNLAATRRTGAATFPRRMPPREMSSSIASNLASARGIRAPQAHALSPSLTATDAQGAMGPPPTRRRPHQSSNQNSPQPAQRPSWLPPNPELDTSRSARRDDSQRQSRGERDEVSMADSAREHARDAQATLAEEGFAKFYSAFESLKSKLSAPLAFAGLPLISEEETPSSSETPTLPVPASRGTGRRTSTAQEPDLTKYFSRAAIKASLTTSQAAVNDSFYVVPTSGGSISYAQMVGYTHGQDKDSPQTAGDGEGEDDEGEEDFVDAREHPLTPQNQSFGGVGSRTPSAGKSTLLRKASTTAGAGGKSAEELLLENSHLKVTLDAAATALEKEKMKLRKYQMESQAGTIAVHNLLAESGVLPRSGGSSVHNSIHGAMGTGGGVGIGASVFGALAGFREQSTGIDVEVLRKEIEGLRADYGKEKRLRRKLESDAAKSKVESEKERNEAVTEMERMRKEMEAFRGDALKYRQLEKSAREKAERRRREGRAKDEKGSERGSGSGGGVNKGDDDNGTKAADNARFVSG